MSRIEGCLFGLAIGDALAAPTEFLTYQRIVEKFGLDGPEKPSARVTDDTQMTLAVGEALLEAPTPFEPESLEEALRNAFVSWAESSDNNRAPGMTCMEACGRLADGRDWIECTVLSSKGCGANMRVAPVGLLPHGKHGVTARTRGMIAQFQAALTHAHPTALAAADLTCAAIADLCGGGDLTDLLTRLRNYAESHRTMYHSEWLGEVWERPGVDSPQEFIALGWDDCHASLDRLEQALAVPDKGGDPCLETGEGWIAEEAFATGLLCFLLHPDDPVRAVRRAAVTTGDSDSIACLTGAFAGAYHGLDAWPVEWVREIEYHDRIRRLASELERRGSDERR